MNSDSYERNLFVTRYKAPGSDEEEWRDVFRRVARAVTADAAMAAEHFAAMDEGLFIPGSPQLWNYGTNRRSARNGGSCYTGKMGDSLKKFRTADSDAEDVYVSSGGFGLMLDSVRPRGAYIKHCSEGAMGSMCDGGPALRIEGTTGYITGSGRARGALMLQLGIRHPDIVEFILKKRPTVIGWLDDWPANAASLGPTYGMFAALFTVKFLHRKDWPVIAEVSSELGEAETRAAIAGGIIVVDAMGRAVPHVFDWGIFDDLPEHHRPAHRDWSLPLQNCNMSVRFSDEFMYAVDADLPWTLFWESTDRSEPGEGTHLRTDVSGALVNTTGTLDCDPNTSAVTARRDGSSVPTIQVVLTTWEGVRDNLSPNQNQWRDTDHARFFRAVVLPQLEAFSGRIKARQLWQLFCENSWNHADPAAVFSSTYTRWSPVDEEKYGERLSNPCAEFVNPPGGSCNLCSVDLRGAVARAGIAGAFHRWTPDHWSQICDDDLDALTFEIERAARAATKYITDSMELSIAPVDYIHDLSLHHFRTIGVGIMGLAEAMSAFGIEYGSMCSQSFAAFVMSTVAITAWRESFAMARSGRAKPLAWESERMIDIFEMRAELAKKYGLPASHFEAWIDLADRVRNGEYATHTCVTSVAPTGTISMIAGWHASAREGRTITVTSGIEPPFSWVTHRQDASGSTVVEYDGGRDIEPWMKTAGEVSPTGHVDVQAAVTSFTCMAVSKTVNLPESATVQDMSSMYHRAWVLGVPATALYRNNSKPMQVLTALDCPSGECKTGKAAK